MDTDFDNIIEFVTQNRRSLKKLGRGGQADVYLYRNNNSGIEYAVRIPKSNLSENEKFILEKIRDLKPKNLVEVLYFDGHNLITPVYEYDANKWMEKKRDNREWKIFIKDLKQGINELKKIGVCHRDLKPRNILVKKGRFYITDFGHSWALEIQDKFKTETELCIKNKLDNEHILNLVPRLKVNNMVKKYSLDFLISNAKKYDDFYSYYKKEKKINKKNKIPNNLKKFLLTKSVCYFLVEKNDKITYIDGVQKLPSKMIEEKIKETFTVFN